MNLFGRPLFGKRSSQINEASEVDYFDDEFLHQLELLQFASRRILRGRQRGERHAKNVGSGLEFADHREYSPGDDIRNVDWNVMVRLNQSLIRLFHEDQDLPLRIAIDVSDSMATRGGKKLRYAKQLAAALAHIGLSNLDRVGISSFSGSEVHSLPITRGKARIFRVFAFLRQNFNGGKTALHQACSRLAAESQQPGIAVVISDFYDLNDPFSGLNLLRFRKHEPICIQVIDPDEANPHRLGLHGQLKMIDCESPDAPPIDLSIDRSIIDSYIEAHENFCQHLAKSCRTRGIPYFRANINIPFDEMILRMFRQGGILQ